MNCYSKFKRAHLETLQNQEQIHDTIAAGATTFLYGLLKDLPPGIFGNEVEIVDVSETKRAEDDYSRKGNNYNFSLSIKNKTDNDSVKETGYVFISCSIEKDWPIDKEGNGWYAVGVYLYRTTDKYRRTELAKSRVIPHSLASFHNGRGINWGVFKNDLLNNIAETCSKYPELETLPSTHARTPITKNQEPVAKSLIMGPVKSAIAYLRYRLLEKDL